MKFPRWIVLPVAACLIAGLMAYKWSQPRQVITPEQRLAVTLQRRAPLFSLYDANNRIVRLERYLSREKILVLFFDGEKGCDKDPLLAEIRQHYAAVSAQGVIVAVSAATPWKNREAQKSAGEFPFPILSDADYSVQTEYECLAGDPPRTRPSAFVIDRLGVIRWSRIGGKSPPTVAEIVEQLRLAR